MDNHSPKHDSSIELEMDVRIVATTNTDLPRLSAEGKFKADHIASLQKSFNRDDLD